MSTRYKIRQKLFSIGDDFWIENQDGQKVFKVDGKALRLRKTLIFEDMDGNKLCQIQERWLPIKETMAIDGPDGEQMAVVRKALITPLRDKWDVKVKGGPDLDVHRATSLTLSMSSSLAGTRSPKFRRNGSA
jgi:uncharacterized protein YxjI